MASPTKNDENHSIISLDSSERDAHEIFIGDSNHFTNVPVIKGEMTATTSTRSGKIVFMNGFTYLYMNMAEETTTWWCARRNENCKVVIHISQQIVQFSQWNGIFHCRPLLNAKQENVIYFKKIKYRVLDEYVSIKIVIEEEYRKANLSAEE